MDSFLQQADTAGDYQKPDIYLILLDAHTSAYTLQEAFGHDNSTFTQDLESMGFYVAECAQSNYPVTNLSVTSTFYANYHETPTLYPVYSSLTIETLRAQGYEVITFQNRSRGHFSLGEDQRLSRNQMLLGQIDLTGGLSEFHFMLIQTSLLRLAIDMPQLLPWFRVQSPQEIEYYEHYQQTYFILDELKRLPQNGGPKFVFAHIIAPHPPFVFGVNGEKINPAEYLTPTGSYTAKDYKRGYLQVIPFLNKKLETILPQIIKDSAVPPIRRVARLQRRR